MRRIILLSSILLLSAVWAVSQYDSAVNSDSKPSSKTMAVEGCLDGAIGNYTLTDPSGATYQLIGNTEQLKAHVGETMRVSGVVTPVTHVPGAMSEGTQTEPTLSVISFKRVSAICNDLNYIP